VSSTVNENFPKPKKATGTRLAAGATVKVETADVVDSDNANLGDFIPVIVVEDVLGPDGSVVVPAYSTGIVAVLDVGRGNGVSSLALGLYQLTIGDQSRLLNHGTKNLGMLIFRENASKGVGHRSVHLERRSVLKFQLSEGIDFSRSNPG